MVDVPDYAVFGHPIAHSLSPRLHRWFSAQTDVPLHYIAIDAEPAGFAGAVRAFFAAGGRGANVTLPHKAAAFALAPVRSAAAGQLGVANLLTALPEGDLEADSNDGAGMLADLRGRCGIDPRGREVLLLGAGGAARAAAFALLGAGAATLTIVNRTPERAQALEKALAAPGRVRVIGWTGLAEGGPFDLVVDATSAGIHHATLRLPGSLVHARTTAYDLSYGPAAGSFLAWAQRAGCAAAFDGLGMLVETAAASFARWHGVRPDGAAALRMLGDLPRQ